MKPSRSDEAIPAEEQEAIKAQVTEYFDSHAPKRAPKPSRSEVGEGNFVYGADEPGHVDMPEKVLLEKLNQDKTPVLPTSQAEVGDPEDYPATSYYQSVTFDTPHCPTGQGFIRLDAKTEPPVRLADNHMVAASLIFNPHPHTNPGGNDWITE